MKRFLPIGVIIVALLIILFVVRRCTQSSAGGYQTATVTRGPITRHTAFQFGAGTEVGYRVHGWEGAGALSYGRGRAGDYQRVGASVTLRMVP